MYKMVSEFLTHQTQMRMFRIRSWGNKRGSVWGESQSKNHDIWEKWIQWKFTKELLWQNGHVLVSNSSEFWNPQFGTNISRLVKRGVHTHTHTCSIFWISYSLSISSETICLQGVSKPWKILFQKPKQSTCTRNHMAHRGHKHGFSSNWWWISYVYVSSMTPSPAWRGSDLQNTTVETRVGEFWTHRPWEN